MHRIHRRKNQQISKQFLCPQTCGKAYGSYAALYTHIKNKHPASKPPEMKAGHIKVKQVVHRKSKFEKERVVHQIQHHFDYDCKVCRQKDCICFQDINGEQLDRNISLMGDQAFIKFVNCVGQLSIRDKFTWTRNTEDTYEYFTKEMLREITYKFNTKYPGNNIIVLSSKWMQFLSLSSKYWDQKYIHELYNAIIAIMSRDNTKQINQFFKIHENQFKNINKCMQLIPKEWAEFVELVKII